ncbi:uncharacterized protein J3D65DRAFT_626422 [Phyllosticta citribraziliensis]|uniref:Uncharacterized protein n=1 Tax=Phyllosticta citribraziliensis TaxID=989973 RepID=A0ABR1LKV2_9PEZI
MRTWVSVWSAVVRLRGVHASVPLLRAAEAGSAEEGEEGEEEVMVVMSELLGQWGGARVCQRMHEWMDFGM